MKKDFEYKENEKKKYFEGWYFKHSANNFSFACIPGICESHSFIQIITNKESFYFKFAKEEFIYKEDIIYIKENKFSLDGIYLNILDNNISIRCNIKYTNNIYSNENIMGPFKNNDCKHYIISLINEVNGEIKIRNTQYKLEKSLGYIEKDLGTSFPEKWIWIQANDKDSSYMFAYAKVKFLGIKLMGLISIVYINGIEYKFATYKLGKVIKNQKEDSKIKVAVKQGNYTLEINLTLDSSYRLAAPKNGEMKDKVLESLNSQSEITLRKKDKEICRKKYFHTAAEYNM